MRWANQEERLTGGVRRTLKLGEPPVPAVRCGMNMMHGEIVVED